MNTPVKGIWLQKSSHRIVKLKGPPPVLNKGYENSLDNDKGCQKNLQLFINAYFSLSIHALNFKAYEI